MVIDTSALLAILQLEPEAREFTRRIENDDVRLISAVSFYEASILAMSRRGPEGLRELEAFIRDALMTITPFDEEQAVIAREAYTQYGKGQHPAALNFADCVAYALAKSSGEALLYKGADFAKTDIAEAV